MAFNYRNQTLENMIPLFSTMANSSGAMGNHPNFINQLAAALTTAVGGSGIGGINATPPVTTTAAGADTKRECTPEPPPAPKFSSVSPPKMKPNQGSTAPMDLELDSEIDAPIATTSSAIVTSSGTVAAKAFEKMPLNMHDPNIFLNGFMPPTSMNTAAASGYMFFPTATTTTDPTAMMAAMQQMHQSYAAAAGYTLPDSTGSVDVAAAQQIVAGSGTEPYGTTAMKEVIKTKNSILFPPNPNAPPPTIRERPPGCRTVFVGGLPENISEEIIREIFESCGEVTTLRMSKKNFCHIRYRHEASIDRAIYLSGYRVRISNLNEPANFGRLHVDYAQARDDQYDYECKQRQLQREQRHRDRISIDRIRSLSPPPMPHYTEHEASLVAESLRSNETFVKAIQTISAWLERGDCTKRNANVFYSMIQSTHAHVRRLYTDKQQLDEDLRKARESYRKQMLSMSTQFTQIEKVFNAASHKKVWDHFTKAQRKNIDQWKKLNTELRSVHIEDDEMEMSDDDRNYPHSAKRARFDSDSLKEENDSLRCQLEALRNEMSLVRTDIKYDSDFREKQIKVLQETIRNMQTQLMQTKVREQKDAKIVEQLQHRLKEAGVKQLLLKTKIKETSERLKDKEALSSRNSEASEIQVGECGGGAEGNYEVEEIRDKQQLNNKEKEQEIKKFEENNIEIIDIDVYKSYDDLKIIEENHSHVETREKYSDSKSKKEFEKVSIFSKLKDITTKEEIKRSLDEGENLKETEFKNLCHFEAKIIALAAAYLVVHPFGVTTESICAYLCNVIKSLEMQTSSLEGLLKTYTNLFQAEIFSDPKAVTLKWKFCGFLDNNDLEIHCKTNVI